jgi:hypothetical protein
MEQYKLAKQEILFTERSYVEDLSTAVDVYMKPLLAASETLGVPKASIHTVFNNLEVILVSYLSYMSFACESLCGVHLYGYRS